jgi:two-component system sensor histidine kinase KdpD
MKIHGEWRELNAGLLISMSVIVSGAASSPFVPFTSAIPLFLCALLFVAWKFPLRVALGASFVATLTLDFFFTKPRYAFRVLNADDVAALSSFLAAVLVISVLSNRLSARTLQLIERQATQVALNELAQRSLLIDWRQPVAEELCRAVRTCFRLESVGMFDATEPGFAWAGDGHDNDSLRAAFMAQRDFDLPRSNVALRILRSGVRPIGCLHMQGKVLDPAITGAVATLVSLTMERARAVNGEVLAQSESLAEQLRASVLDGLAHSIKTPLTTIAISSEGAVAIGGLTRVQSQLLERVQEQTFRITSLTDKLLRTARLDAKTVVRRKEVDVAVIVRKEVSDLNEDRRFLTSGAEEPVLIWTDPDLLKMAVNQVAENAIKYSPPQSPVCITLKSEECYVSIIIHNEGAPIPATESKLIFKRFYRSPSVAQRAPGTGLGLSVAQRAIEALGGQIMLDSEEESGTTFTIQIPKDGGRDAGLNTDRRG